MDFDLKQLVLALRSIAEEKNLPEATVQEIIEQALAAAWRRDHGDRDQEVRASLNLSNGDVHIFLSREVYDRKRIHPPFHGNKANANQDRETLAWGSDRCGFVGRWIE